MILRIFGLLGLTGMLLAAGVFFYFPGISTLLASEAYRWEVAAAEVAAASGQQISIRLIGPDGATVEGAEIVDVRLDMAPEGMAAMDTSITPEAAGEAGDFVYRADFTMAGRWALHVKAKIPGRTDPMEGEIILTASDPAKKPDMSAEGRKIAYYRNPMGLPDTSPVPKQDSMGMDYIPVYEDEEIAGDSSIVKVSVEKVQRAGVKTERVATRVISEPLHVPGSIQLDERREQSITLRAEGFVEKVYAGVTGQHVKAGEPLFRIYRQQIVQAAVDYRIAASQGQKQVGARKLRNLGVPEAFINSIPSKGDIPPSMDWPSPVDGVLMSKNIVVGARVMPGDELYRLADVSTVWVIADVPELDVGRLKIGDPAAITVRAFPGETFTGKVAFVLPELKAETRTAQVRIELPNPGHKLLHRMYVDVAIDTGQSNSVLAVPASAIIDSGMRQVAIVEVGEGRFKPQEVKLGRRGGGYVEILEGLTDGDKVVTRANFLIDAESNLQAALTALTSNEGSVQ